MPDDSSPARTSRPARFDIVDALTVAGPWRDRKPGQPYGFDDLLEEHARFGIQRRLTLHAEARDGVPENGNAEMSRQTLFRDDTATIWTALPSRRFGGQSSEQLLADAQTAGVAMFALFPERHGHHIAPWANSDLYRAMESARLPLLLDLDNAQGNTARSRYEEVHAIAAAHPRLPVVLWNAFYMDERLQIPLLDVCPNVRIGIATVFIPTWGIEQYTARYGPDRLIFGSNWPRQSPGPLLTYVLYADVGDRVKAAILGGTIRTLAEDVRWPVRGFGPARPKKAPTWGPRRTLVPAEPPATRSATEEDEPQASGAELATPWLAAMASEQEDARRPARQSPPAADDPLDPRRSPGEEGQ